MRSFPIGKTRIHVVAVDEAADAVKQSIRTSTKGYVCVSNMRTVVAANQDSAYREVMSQSLFNTPDGTPLVWCGRLWGIRDVQRTCGPDLFDKLLRDNDPLLRHYFLGDTDETLQKLTTRLSNTCAIAGSYSPPFKPLEEYDLKGIAAAINESGATVVWTSLRAPKQDFLAIRLLPYLNDNVVLIGVGAAFRIFLGEYQKPQGILQKIGLGGLMCLRNTNFIKELRWYFKHTLFLIKFIIEILFLRIFAPRKSRQMLVEDAIPVLVLGDGLQALALARGLFASGYRVDVAAKELSVVRRCRYLYRTIPLRSEENMDTDALVSLINEQHYCVVIPTRDVFADWLSQHKEIIEKHTNAVCAVMSQDVYAIAANKMRLMQFCQNNGFPCPFTIPLNAEADYLDTALSFPSIFKPACSDGSRGIKMVHSLEQLRELSSQYAYGDGVVQEYIHDHDYYYNAMLYRCADGSFAAHTIVKILRYYPVSGGSSGLCQTVENNSILNICESILNALDWVGFADFDLLEKGDGDYRVIEINPRVPACLRAASVSGVDFGTLIVRDSLGQSLPQYSYQPGRYLRCLGLDIAWFVASPNRFRTHPSWFKFFGKNIFYQEGGVHDFWAMCASIVLGVKKQLNPEFRKQKSGM